MAGEERRRQRAFRDVAYALTGVAIVLWALGATRAKVDPIAPTFVELLHPFYLLAILALSVAFWLTLTRAGAPQALLGGQLFVLAVFLHLTPFLIEGVARFRTNWRNVGYSEYFERHDHADPSGIWYHNWPAFFAEGHAILDAFGDRNVLLGVYPLVMALVILGAALGLFSYLFGGEPRRTFTAAWLFLAANWINQELFGPQPLAFATFLVLVALTAETLRQTGRWGESAATTRATIILLFCALAVYHPLTSVFYVTGLLVLAIFVRTERRLVGIATLLLLTWLAYGAYDYLLWKLGPYLQELGDPLAILNRGFGKSVQHSPEGAFVGRMRTLYAAAICLMGVLAIFLARAWRPRRDRAVALWAGVPFAFLAGFSYDGEIFLRVFLFSLPFFAYFVARELWSPARRASLLPASRAFLAPAIVLLAALHPAIHYGEDKLDFVHERELAAMRTFYERAQPGTRILPFTNNNLAEAYHRDTIGVVWAGYVTWQGDALDWRKADWDVGKEVFAGAQYVWLTDGDHQEFTLRRNAPTLYGETLARMRLATAYPGFYDSGGSAYFYVPAGEGARL